MGVKGESNSQRAKPLATGEQLRLARLTLEGNSSDEDPSNIQRLIKKKSKKEKKKDEDDRRPTRGQSSTRGRGVFSDRGTRGRSGGGGPSRGASRGAHASARGRGALSSGSGGSQRAQPSGPLSEASPKTVSADTDLSEENNDWKTGPMVY
uniref:SMG6 n=1 Tax=Heterorhabditis bacteriophora TaxID=37862 RepID=A0A1I7XQ44_HETBA